eukprot:SM000060S19605  [mRNA]  locus=s60:89103:89465:- [translate_table: standard]
MPGAAAGKTFKLRVREAASMGSVKRDICTKVPTSSLLPPPPAASPSPCPPPPHALRARAERQVRILPQWLELYYPKGMAVADDVTPWDLRMRGGDAIWVRHSLEFHCHPVRFRPRRPRPR